MTDFAVLEQEALANTRSTARRGVLSKHTCVRAETFATNAQFSLALQSCVRALVRIPNSDRKLLVISAHGVPLTGTNLAASDDETINLWSYEDHLAALPRSIVVFFSACFGGYPSVTAVQRRSQLCVLGPLVDILPSDANALQNELLDVLALGGTFRSILRLVLRRNKTLRASYEDRFVFGLHDHEGNFFPRRAAGAQLAAEVIGPITYQILELFASASDGTVRRCRLKDDAGKFYDAGLAPLLRHVGVPQDLVGRRFRGKYQVLTQHEDQSHSIVLLNPHKR